jgi:predicted amidohydrolase YtcJ
VLRPISRWGATALVISMFTCSHREPAELVLLGGNIVTLDPENPDATALAAREGRIIAIGSDEQIEPLIDKHTQVIRLHDDLVIPGFIESHGHIRNLGLLRLTVDLTATRSWDEVLAKVGEAAAKAKPGSWIFGRGWHQEMWDRPPAEMVEGYPTNGALNEAAQGHPVLLRHRSGHAAVASSLALAEAGIDDRTKDPEGGRIVRDHAGHATGVLIENAEDSVMAAMEAAKARRPQAEQDDELARAIEVAQDECLAKGITTFEDAGLPLETVDKIKAMALGGRLKMRFWMMLRDDNARLAERLPQYRLKGVAGGFFTVGGIKRQMDGALGSHGAWLLQPYSDEPATSGLNTEPLGDIEEAARLAIENGFQLCVHAIGDRATRETLDLFERTFRKHPDKSDLRWRIEHAQLVSPVDLPRFFDLGVIASMQGIHCTSDGPWVPMRIGTVRAREEAYLWRELTDTGAVVCNGTDTPVEDVDPIANFHASVTRVLADGSVFFARQRMSRQQALRSYTVNAAYAAFEDDVKGSLTVGKLADIVILTKNILTIPDDEIETAKVAYTIVGGKIVHRAGSLQAARD